MLLFSGLLIISLTSCGKSKQDKTIQLVFSDGNSLHENVTIGKNYKFIVPEKFGYSFEGWYDINEKPYTDKSGIGFDVWKNSYPSTLYASWKANKYDIVLNPGKGIFEDKVSEYSAYYDSDVSNLVLPIPHLNQFTFVGYYTSSSGGTRLTDDQGKILPDVSLFNDSNYIFTENKSIIYAQYDVQKTTYIVQGSSNTFKLNVGDIIINLEYEIKDGYAFTGYYLDDTFTKRIEYPFQVEYSENAITIYPKYEKCTEIGLSYNSISNDKEYEAIYSGDAKEVIIPDSYFGKNITAVSRVKASSAQRIVVPNTVKTIAPSAFENNYLLEDIVISNNITKFEDNAFNNCYKLKSINISNSVKEIGNLTFGNCKSIDQIILPSSVEKIGNKAFYNMENLKKFEVSSENKNFLSINDVLYRKASSSLYLVQYPINKDAYEFNVEKDTYKIENYAFYNTKLRKISFDNSKLSSIGEYAFANSQKLITISIVSKNDLIIMDHAFENCSILSSIILNTTNKVEITSTTYNNVNNNLRIFVSSNLIKEYATDVIWKNRKDNILSLGTIFGEWSILDVEGGVKIISYFGTKSHLEIPSVINGKKVISIGELAFIYNDAIQELLLPSTIKEIEDSAFKYNTNLKSVFISSPLVIDLKGTPFDINENINFYLKDGAKDLLQEYRNSWVNYESHIWTANN